MAKTTTVHSLGVASAEFGRQTLVVDLDPQACLTFSLGFDPDSLERSLHDVFVRRDCVADVCLPVPGVPDLDLLPATIDLAGSEVHLLTRTGREHVLERALEPVLGRYDLDLDRLPPVPRSAHHQRADRGRFACSSRCSARPSPTVGSASCSRPSRTCGPSPTAASPSGHHRHHVRRPDQALPAHHRGGRVPVRDTRAPAAGAQVDPVRRGTGTRKVDPPARPEFARGAWPTAQLARTLLDMSVVAGSPG